MSSGRHSRLFLAFLKCVHVHDPADILLPKDAAKRGQQRRRQPQHGAVRGGGGAGSQAICWSYSMAIGHLLA